jgi:hypothetical protein
LNRKKREKPRRPLARSTPVQQTVLDRARDELFSAIRQCGVFGAEREDQIEWMDETLGFMKERHPELSRQELGQLREAGLRFCQPVIPHGREHTAIAHEEVLAPDDEAMAHEDATAA